MTWRMLNTSTIHLRIKALARKPQGVYTLDQEGNGFSKWRFHLNISQQPTSIHQPSCGNYFLTLRRLIHLLSMCSECFNGKPWEHGKLYKIMENHGKNHGKNIIILCHCFLHTSCSNRSLLCRILPCGPWRNAWQRQFANSKWTEMQINELIHPNMASSGTAGNLTFQKTYVFENIVFSMETSCLIQVLRIYRLLDL